MDLFKFTPTVSTDATLLQNGQQINGYQKVMWVERYSEPGEFSIEAQLSSGLGNFLPLGTIISHADTLYVMIVENQEITEKEKEDPTLIITGRGFESYLENRVVGMNASKSNSAVTPYVLPADYTWNQAVKVINDHIVYTDSVYDSLVNVIAQTSVTGTGASVSRNVDYGTVWERAAEILKVEDLGIKTIRRNTFGVLGSSTQTVILVYRGVDKTSSIIFSWKAGDLSSAKYLFSNKADKNTALVLGQYVTTVVETGPTQYDRRTMLVDAKDIDGHLGAMPSGATLTAVVNAMITRGQQVLAAQNRITLSQADISPTAKYQFRRDYDIGDLILLDGNFGQIVVMRVVEYAEIEDENGESGHPTLALPGV